MKINLPVTDTEYVLKDMDSVISGTGPKGTTIFINADFIRISGFAKEESIGSLHNIVHHPDMLNTQGNGTGQGRTGQGAKWPGPKPGRNPMTMESGRILIGQPLHAHERVGLRNW